MEHFFVYMLLCSDGSYYIGHTDNLEKRIADHTNGQGCAYTSKRLPIRLVFVEQCSTRDEAFALERKIKGWSHKKKAALIKQDWQEISRLAKKKSKLTP